MKNKKPELNIEYSGVLETLLTKQSFKSDKENLFHVSHVAFANHRACMPKLLLPSPVTC